VELIGLTAAEQVKRRDLRRMKVVATGFLVSATVVFVLARVFAGPAWLGFVETAAEAGMVGALADWFAVTALFRRPMGLPIPHTAIIPTRKDTLGRSLGDFVSANFLSIEVVRDKLARAHLVSRIGGWLAKPDNADRATAELSNAANAALRVLRDEDVQEVIENAVVSRLVSQPWGPPLGKLLGQIFADGSHRKLVDLVCDRAYDWVRDNHNSMLDVVSQRAPSWSPKFIDDLVGERVYNQVLSFAWAVKTEPDHQLRKAVDTFLVEFTKDLQHDDATIRRAEEVKSQVLDHPEVQRVVGSAWATAKRMLLDAADDPDSQLRIRVRDGLVSLGERLAADGEWQDKVEGWLRDAADYVVKHYAAEITTLITDTVERWDGAQTSRKIELQVGRDLQFIRINGTVVGALAGLLIHTVSVLLL
jgi:uncharacterized membrane-anchored protein YjiN (DUF445 family)